MKYLNSIETWNVFVLTILLTITNSRDYATGVELCLTQKKMVRVAVVGRTFYIINILINI